MSLWCILIMTFSGHDATVTKNRSFERLCLEILVLNLLHYRFKQMKIFNQNHIVYTERCLDNAAMM